MPINREALLNWQFPEVKQSYSERDTMLYALGLGIGSNPLDPAQLRFVYEKELQTLPTMGVILGRPGFWLSDPRTGANWRKLLHGEQSIEVMRPLLPAGDVIGRTRVVEVLDKGAGRGALVYTEREILDALDGSLLCRQRSTTVLRDDGGFGGPSGPAPKPHPVPERPADCVIAVSTSPQAALIYRLSGDYNPLHADPEIASAGGFERPILHGLCTFGIAGYAVVAGVAGGNPARVRFIAARFTAPVFPGETVETELWHEPNNVVAFRAHTRERGIVVLNNGHAVLQEAATA